MRSNSPDSLFETGITAEHCKPSKGRRYLWWLFASVAVCALSACSSDTDTISLGNGLSSEVSADATSGENTSFLGAPPAEIQDDGETQDTSSEPPEPVPNQASAGIGGATAPLDDETEPALASVGGAATPADDGNAIDLSDDILIPPDAPELEISATIGALVFSWQIPNPELMPGAFSIDIDRFDTDTGEVENVVSDLDTSTNVFRLPVVPHLFGWETSEFILSICTVDDCLRSLNTSVSELLTDSINRVESSAAAEFDFFGGSLSTAANGRILLAGKPGHDAGSGNTAAFADGDNSIENGEPVFDAGAAELLFEVENEWFSAAQLQQPSPTFNSQFGFAVAADGSGDTIVIGAPLDSSELELAGAAYVFVRAGESWILSAVLSQALPRTLARFGHSVAISDDGRLIAVGAPGDSNATIDPFSPLDSQIDAGSVTLFRLDDGSSSWIISDYVRSPEITTQQRFGEAIALDESASTLVIAAPGEIPVAPRAMPGVVHIFDIQSAGILSRQQLFQLAEAQQDPQRSAFGTAISISADGTTVLASCLNRPQTAGFSNQLNKPQSEIVVYSLSASNTYSELQRLTPAGEHGFDTLLSVTQTANGNKIATAALNPDSAINTVTIFQQSDLQGAVTNWNMVNSFEAPESGTLNFATSLEFSNDGERLFIGAEQAGNSGRVYVY